MKKIVLLCAAALALAACSGPAPADPAAPLTGTAPASVPTAPAPKTDQGFIPKKIGEQAAFTNPDGGSAADFWITKITVDPKCGPYMKRNPGKHTLLIDVTIQTHTSDADPGFVTVAGAINPFSLQTKGEDGVTNQAEFGTCVASPKALPTSFAANSKYTGQMEVETSNPHGALLMAASGGLTNTGGWEWKY